MFIISALCYIAKCFHYAHYYVTLAKWAVAVAVHKKTHNILSHDHTSVSHVTCGMATAS